MSYLGWNGNFTTKFVSSDVVSSRLVLLNRGKIKASPKMETEWEIPMEGRQLRGKNEKCVWFSSTDKARLISRHGLLFPTAIAWLPSCILSSDSFIPFLPSFLPLCEECCDAFRVFIPVSHFRPLQNSQNLLHPCVSWISRTLYVSVKIRTTRCLERDLCACFYSQLNSP